VFARTPLSVRTTLLFSGACNTSHAQGLLQGLLQVVQHLETDLNAFLTLVSHLQDYKTTSMVFYAYIPLSFLGMGILTRTCVCVCACVRTRLCGPDTAATGAGAAS
jgi:hypothetical protein